MTHDKMRSSGEEPRSTHEEWDLNAWVEEERAKGTSDQDIATKLEEKATKKEQMVSELRAKAEELRSGSTGTNGTTTA